MTTRPEDAMTRERVLSAMADAMMASDDTEPRQRRAYYVALAAVGYDAALASAPQEPAPAEDAEEDFENRDPNERVSIPRIEILNRDKRITALEAQLRQQSPEDLREKARKLAGILDELACEAPEGHFSVERAVPLIFTALRRYAGNGEVTDEQVEAAARILATQRGHKNLAEPIRCTGNITRAVWQFYCDDARQILKAAARAKPNKEKS